MKNFEVTLSKTYRFIVSAENEEEVFYYLQTHDFGQQQQKAKLLLLTCGNYVTIREE